MAIHLVQRSHAYDACRRARAETDIIVLVGEGVNAMHSSESPCLASLPDAVERGIAENSPSHVRLITDAEMVSLCATHHPVVNWNQP